MTKTFLAVLLGMFLSTTQSVFAQTNSAESFRIKYEKKVSSREVKKMSVLLDSTASALSQRLNVPLRRKFDVQLYATPDRLKKEFRSSLFDDGVYKNNKIYLVTVKGLADESKAQDAVSRVAARAVLSQLQFCPVWLIEAYSFYAGNAVARFNRPSRSNILTFHDLSEDFARAERMADQKEIYAKLAATISFLVDRYGEKKVESLFAQFNDGAGVEEVFESTFGEKITVIEQEWVKAVTPQAR